MEEVNICLITLDSLRSDYLPFLLEKIQFPGKKIYLNTYSRNFPTIYAFTPILNGVPVNTVSNKIGIQKFVPSLPKILKREGYSTVAFIDRVPYLSRIYGYGKGFDVFSYGLNSYKNENKGEPTFLQNIFEKGNVEDLFQRVESIFPPLFYLREFFRYKLSDRNCLSFTQGLTNEILNTAFQEINGLNRKFFLFIHLMDVHYPYKFSLSLLKNEKGIKDVKNIIKFLKRKVKNNLRFHTYIRKYTPNNRRMNPNKFVKANKRYYKLAIKYVAEKLDQFIEKVYKNFPETIFLITSDHGEGFGEHGYYGHHWGTFHYEEILKVPLIILHPDLTKEQKIKKNISTLDVPPTILGYTNIEVPEVYQGKKLTERERDDIIACESFPMPNASLLPKQIQNYKSVRTVISKDWKFTENQYFRTQRLINLSKDPFETKNLISTHTKLFQTLKNIIK